MNARKTLNNLQCSCSNCKFVLRNTSHLTTYTSLQKELQRDADIRIGDRVLVQGLFTGMVKYVGDLDSKYINDQTFIGVKLDEPVGKNNGLYEGKRFFHCPDSHGLIVPIHHTHLLVPREGCRIRTDIHPKSRFPLKKAAQAVSYRAQTRGPAPVSYIAGQRKISLSGSTNTSTLESIDITEEVPKTASKASWKCHLPFLGKHSTQPKKDESNVKDSSSPAAAPTSIAMSISSPSRSVPHMKTSALTKLPAHNSSPELTSAGVLAQFSTDFIDTVPTHSEILGAQAETSQTFYINSVGDKQFESTEVLGTTAGSKEASEQSRPCTEAPTTTSSTHDALSGRVESDAELHVTPAMSRSPTSGRSAGESGSGAYATYATSDAFFSGSGVDSGVVTTTPSGSQVPKVKDKTEAPWSEGPMLLADIYHYCSSSSSGGSEEDYTSELVRDLQNSEHFSQDYRGDHSRSLMSGLLARDGTAPPTQFNEDVTAVGDFKELVKMWGGGEKGFHMALTLQKLRAAEQKGRREMQWQNELLKMDKDDEFSVRRRELNNLKEEIVGMERKSGVLEELAQKKQGRKDIGGEIAELKRKIQRLQKKNSRTMNELNHHPAASPEVVHSTITRITNEYYERRRTIVELETSGGNSILQWP